MNNSVSVEGVEEVARSLKNIELILRDNYEDIKKTMLELNANISKLNQMNGQDAITSPYPSTLTPISDGALGEILYNKQYYKSRNC